jgi:hypothetical protein
MSSLKEFTEQKPKLTNVSLWVLSAVITLACFTYQNRTGPTYPLEGSLQTSRGTVEFKFQRSQTLGEDLNIVLSDPVPPGIDAFVKYRRFRSNDQWSVIYMQRGSYDFSRRGQNESVKGIGAQLPGLYERAGKYEYYVYIADPTGEPVSITGEYPIYARYKAPVPRAALFAHILVIFASMTLALRTTMEALIDGNYRWMILATVGSLVLGGFIFGPLVQWYAFGVWWAGIPHGYDWTDNKVLIELVFWLTACWTNRGQKRNRWPVYLAGLVTIMVYFIPHSMFGSEYNYHTGTGRGTAG